MPINKSKIFLWCFVVLLLVIGVGAGYTWLSLTWSFSSGDRAGFVQKFSHKGWLCRTWEGELAMVPVPGALPEKFFFSVRNDAVAEQINRSLGKRVVLHYEQHKGVPTNCFGETEYFVDQVKVSE
jgi:hypothetical protein